MKRELTLTAINPDGSEVSIVRSFDNEQAAGNFAVCRVRVNGKRHDRISCSRELLVHWNHPSEGYRELYADIVAVTRKDEERAYKRYVKSCHRENLNAHDHHMWLVHGKPSSVI